MVVTLQGELGTGKTTFVRGLLRARGIRGAVKSPTYTLVEHYPISSLYFFHFDFYRFTNPNEWDSAGMSDYFRDDAVCLVEWPERVGDRLPNCRNRISHYRCPTRTKTRVATSSPSRIRRTASDA